MRHHLGLLAIAMICATHISAQVPASQVVEGVLQDIQGKPVKEQFILFVAESNFCPDTCGCGTGKCGDGKASCAEKFCYFGFIARTGASGQFQIPLPSATYSLYVNRISDDALIQRISVGLGRLPSQILKLPRFDFAPLQRNKEQGH